MKEIKFRAWYESSEEKVMLFVGDDHGTTHALDCCRYLIDGQPVSLMQYTGLKDKNGVDIYEGDILSEPASPVGGKDGGYLYKNREIKWKGADSGYELFCPEAASNVIGNIYENPDLIHKAKG